MPMLSLPALLAVNWSSHSIRLCLPVQELGYEVPQLNARAGHENEPGKEPGALVKQGCPLRLN